MSGLDGLAPVAVGSVRVVALFATAPFFGHAAVPVRIRAACALVVAAALAPHLADAPSLEGGTLGTAGAILGEVLVGVTLGFATRLVFAALDVLGEVASIQGGLGVAQAIDPASGIGSAALGQVFGIMGLGVWLAIGGHHELLRALLASYQALPVGGGGPAPDSLLAVAGLAAPLFRLGLQLAAPVVVALVVSNVAVGILGRLIPQLNLITLQLPAHVAMTLLLLGLGAHGLADVYTLELEGWTGRALDALVGEG